MRQAYLRSYSHSEQSKKICHVLEHSAACSLLEEIVGQLVNRNLITRYSVLGGMYVSLVTLHVSMRAMAFQTQGPIEF